MRLALVLFILPLALSIPQYEVDLDREPRLRWIEVAFDYRQAVIEQRDAASKLESIYDPMALNEWMLEQEKSLSKEYREELEGYAQAIDYPGVSVRTLLLHNARYELGLTQGKKALATGCSGIVAAMPNGTVVHGRNFDLAVNTSMARRSAFMVTFKKGGVPLVEAIMYPTIIGFITARRINAYSWQQNTRRDTRVDKPDVLMEENFKAARAGGHLYQLQARKILLESATYTKALEAFRTAKWTSGQYFVLAGKDPWQGAVLSVHRCTNKLSTNVDQLWDGTKGKPKNWFMLQTNDDRWRPPEDDRRALGSTQMMFTGQHGVLQGSVRKAMRNFPLCNPSTVYSWTCENHLNQCQLDLVDCLKAPQLKLRKKGAGLQLEREEGSVRVFPADWDMSPRAPAF